MKIASASRTAQYMALFRAIASEYPFAHPLFYDPFAVRFLDRRLLFAVKMSSIPILGQFMLRYINGKGPGAMTSGIARTAYIDELLKRCIDNGAQQVIILGAGFDTRAQRLDFLKTLPVLEIDHPNTSNAKQEVLKKESENLHYLQIDFNTSSIEDLILKHKIDRSLPTVFIWEGVSNYLHEEAIKDTFECISSFAPGSSCIFTYIHKEVLEHPEKYHGLKNTMATLKSQDEEWTFGFYPVELGSYLAELGLSLIEDTGATDYRKHYLKNWDVQFSKGYEFYRVALISKTAL